MKNVDTINEADEIRDELEELRIQLDQSEIRCKELKKVKKPPHMLKQIENQLMSFHEKLKLIDNGQHPSKPNYFDKFLELKSKNKHLREKFKAAKLDFNKTYDILESQNTEKINLKEELGYTKIENARLISDLESLQQKANRYKSRETSKKLLKKSKIFAIAPSLKTFDKDSSLYCSPLFNQSYQLFTSESKKNPILELTQHKANRGVRLMRLVNP